MSVVSMILVIVITFFAGLEGTLDEFQFHQPLAACTLIGLVTGSLEAGIILNGSLQMIALGWTNIGAAVVPDATLASVTATIIMIKGGDSTIKGIAIAATTIIPLTVAGLFLTMPVHTASAALVHGTDAAAREGNIATVERTHLVALSLQGLRITVPAALLLAVPTSAVQSALGTVPDWLSSGMAIGGGIVVAVGYAMVINMMATSEVWSFFAVDFAVTVVSDLTLIAFGTVGVALTFIYLNLSKKGGNGGETASDSGDPIGNILEDY